MICSLVGSFGSHWSPVLILDTDDGLAACPICKARMKEEAVFTHLDIHNKPETVAQAEAEQSRLTILLHFFISILISGQKIAIIQRGFKISSTSKGNGTSSPVELFFTQRQCLAEKNV